MYNNNFSNRQRAWAARSYLISKAATSLPEGNLPVLLLGFKLTRKATFATDITYMMTLITSKLSVIWFLHTLTLQRVHNHLRRALGLLVIAWGVSGLLAIAFQCPVPDTWQILSQRCFHQVRHQTPWPCHWRQLLNIPHRYRSGTILPFPTLSSNWLS